jgi:hypothetical protein
MSLLLGLRNLTTQTVLTNGTISFGNVYRRYCKKNRCNVPTFSNTSTSVTLQQQGIYHVTATLVGSGTTAGIVSIQLLENGVEVPSAFTSETITTPNTELRTFVIDTYILVDDACLLGNSTTLFKNLSLLNTGIDATFESVVFNVEKVV